MNLILKDLNITLRKLKISDYPKFKKLFYLCFNRNISFSYYKWRYFKNKFCFCYGAFVSSELIAHVGMVSLKINNQSKEIIYSRHSSMVLKKYRGKGIFSILLNEVKKKVKSKVRLIAMWPNKKNFSNFGIDKKKIIKKVFYLYKISHKDKVSKTVKNYKINELIKYKNFIKSDDNLFFKDYFYFKNRYLNYKKEEYFINKFTSKSLTSFFIIKFNNDNLGLSCVILDHFGSSKIKLLHLTNLIKNQNNIIHLSDKKINKSDYKLLNHLTLKIGFLQNFRLQNKNLFKKNISLGDTDIFINIGDN